MACDTGITPNLEFMEIMNYSLVDQTLSMYKSLNAPIDTFLLHAPFQWWTNSPTNFNLLLDKWIQICIHNGVKSVSLQLSPNVTYSLPSSVVESKTLVELHLSQFKLHILASNKSIFSSLRKLHLNRVHIDEDTLAKLLASMSLVQDLSLYLCEGFNTIKVANLDKLKHFDISVVDDDDDDETEQNIEIHDLPSLETLICTAGVWNTTLNNLVIRSPQYPSLRRLSVSGGGSIIITKKVLNALLALCPLLEDLEVLQCKWLEFIEVRSDSLKRIKIDSCEKLFKITLDAPRLTCFEYFEYFTKPWGFPMLSFIHPPSKSLKSFISLKIVWGIRFGYAFSSLREFLRNINGSSDVAVTILGASTHWLCNNIPLGWRPFLEHQVDALYLDVSSVSPTIYPVLFECLFSIIHPKSIYTVSSCYDNNRELIKYLHQNLVIGIEDPNYILNKFGDEEFWEQVVLHIDDYYVLVYQKHWAHYLKHVEFEYGPQGCSAQSVKDNGSDQLLWEPLGCGVNLEDEDEEDVLHDIFEKGRVVRFRLNWF